ncbi:MAG: hypothetical protein GQ574_06300 [Crocinitomix sp.]|nr:hypothetical protein [Crocinitomix sp.]
MKLKLTALFLLLSWFTPPNFSYAIESVNHDDHEIKTEISTDDSLHEGASVHEEHHTDVSPLLFIVFALVIGAATRHFLSKIGLPYTVVLLLIGIGLGVLGRTGVFEGFNMFDGVVDLSIFDQSIDWAANFDPHLILYIFLPILIFEAAFAMDVHTFKKTFTNSALLAVPGILVAIFLTAGIIWMIVSYGFGLTTWSWEVVLLFGAVISATDPVAVVSILKELGASKKISTLIEGESLMNDGTAIVIFMVIFLGLTGNAIDHSPILEFFRVAFGGVLIGYIIGKIALFWIKRVNKDILVEATIIVVSAYLTFFVGEHVFGVSGVLGLVTLGILMSGPGRTRISTEVQHFIHEFWEFTAFAANTLIFLIVGVVIAKRTVFTMNDVWMLLALYVIIHLVRIVVIALLFPLMKRNGYGMTVTDAKVLWWGALRGAIGLALALIVESSPHIDQKVGEEFLFLTAGIVTLTLLINATTMKALANFLGMTKVSPEKRNVLIQAQAYIDSSKDKAVNRLKEDRFFKKVDWTKVEDYVDLSVLKSDSLNSEGLSQDKEFRIRMLEKEKSSYWAQFEDGTLSEGGYVLLMEEVNGILDSQGEKSLSAREDLEELLSTRTKMKGSFIQKLFKKSNIAKLETSFDAAKGFYTAQMACINLLESMYRTANDSEIVILKKIEDEIEENKIQALTYLRNFKREFLEIYKHVSTKQATQTLLNQEKKTTDRLFKQGRITASEKSKMYKLIDDKIIKLKREGM